MTTPTATVVGVLLVVGGIAQKALLTPSPVIEELREVVKALEYLRDGLKANERALSQAHFEYFGGGCMVKIEDALARLKSRRGM